MTQGYREFEFALPQALLEQLIGVLDEMTPAQLTTGHLGDVPEEQGVYQLLLGGELVYIGKTDAAKGLKNRLDRHAAAIRNRHNLSVSQMTFKAVRVFVFTAMDLERQLIAHYGSPPWNHSGFGSNDPGHNREDTELKAGHFDRLYPIDIDRPLEFDLPERDTAASIARKLKAELPYLFRFETLPPKSRKPHPDLEGSNVQLPAGRLSMRQVITEIMKCLPSGWQATDMVNRVIPYKETKPYRFGSIISRS